MKVASFNVNSIRARLEIVTEWMKRESPDVLCVQETKVIDDDFPQQAFLDIDYHPIFPRSLRLEPFRSIRDHDYGRSYPGLHRGLDFLYDLLRGWRKSSLHLPPHVLSSGGDQPSKVLEGQEHLVPVQERHTSLDLHYSACLWRGSHYHRELEISSRAELSRLPAGCGQRRFP